MSWLSHVSVRNKLLMLVLPLAISCTILVFLFVHDKQSDVKTLENQNKALSIIQDSLLLIKLTPQHRGMTNGYLNGNQALESKILDVRAKISAHYETLISKYAAEESVVASLKQLNRTWLDLSRAAFSGPAKQVFSEHTSLIKSVITFMLQTADNYQLTLSPNRETYHMLQVSLNLIPSKTNELGILRGFGSGVIASENFTEANLSRISSFATSANVAIEQISSSYQVIDDLAPELAVAVKEQVNNALSENSGFVATANLIVRKKSSSIASSEYFGIGTKAINSLFELEETLLTLLQEKFSRLIQQSTNEMNVLATVFGVLLIAIIALAILISRALVTGIRKATDEVEAISSGVYTNAIQVAGSDEIATMLGGIDEMRETLRNNISQIEETLTETQRIRSALAGANTAVLITLDDGTFVFQNERCDDLFHTIDPSLDTENSSWPSAIGNQWQDFSETETNTLHVSDRDLSIKYSKVTDDNDTVIAKVFELEDQTDYLLAQKKEQAISRSNARIKSALEDAEANVMVADGEGKLTFINSASAQLFRTRSTALLRELSLSSIDPDALIGESISNLIPPGDALLEEAKEQGSASRDWFYSDLAIKARMAIVRGPDNEAIGLVMEWSDVTQEIQAQTEVDLFIKDAAAGKFDRTIEAANKQGFFKELASGLNDLQSTVKGSLSDISNVAKSLASGNLSQQIDSDYEGVFGEIKEDLNGSIMQLREVVSKVSTASTSVNTTASEIGLAMNDLSGRTEAQASAVEQTSSSMIEMMSTVDSNSSKTQECKTLAQDTTNKAGQGGQVVEEAVSSVEAIKESSQKITEIIGVIDEIAFQTNLLALNAAVEAARAGEQGRGFAVVASEVRGLAQRSSDAAKEIKELINDSVQKVDRGALLVTSTGENLGSILTSVRNVNAMVDEIAIASKEQAEGIAQTNKAIEMIDEGTQRNAAIVEQTSAAGRNLLEQSQTLANAVRFFKF